MALENRAVPVFFRSCFPLSAVSFPVTAAPRRHRKRMPLQSGLWVWMPQERGVRTACWDLLYGISRAKPKIEVQGRTGECGSDFERLRGFKNKKMMGTSNARFVL